MHNCILDRIMVFRLPSRGNRLNSPLGKNHCDAKHSLENIYNKKKGCSEKA